MYLKIRKYLFSILGIVVLIGALKLFNFSTTEENNDATYLKYFHLNYKIFSLNIPNNLNFANEKVPIHDFDVRERIDRELLINTYWQSQTILLHKRANRWFPIIEPILKKNGIPEDFKYLAIIESGLTNAISPAGATGYWQLIESTANDYGLETTKEIDERYHIEKSTQAACKYLKDAYKKFGNWTLSAASYNLGINGISKQQERQKTNNYYDLLLNEETARYVFRIIAIKEIISHPQKYGFHIRKKDLYPPIPTYTIAVDSSISDLASFALSKNINYKLLKLLNPWLRDTKLPNPSKKTYYISLPNENSNNIYENLLNEYDSHQYLQTENLIDSSNNKSVSDSSSTKK